VHAHRGETLFAGDAEHTAHQLSTWVMRERDTFLSRE
jgi:hypothetical protein